MANSKSKEERRQDNIIANREKRDLWSEKTGSPLSVSMSLDAKGFERRIFEALGPKVITRMNQFADSTIRTSKSLSPRQTGHNASSITFDTFKDGNVLQGQYRNDLSDLEMARGIGFRVYTQSGYGAYLELGTKFMKAIPYLWPAFNQHARRFAAALTGIAKS